MLRHISVADGMDRSLLQCERFSFSSMHWSYIFYYQNTTSPRVEESRTANACCGSITPRSLGTRDWTSKFTTKLKRSIASYHLWSDSCRKEAKTSGQKPQACRHHTRLKTPTQSAASQRL